LELGEVCRFPVTVAHCNHQLRGEESDRDETFTRELCRKKGVPFCSTRLELCGLPTKGNLEDRARLARYDFLAGVAAPSGAVVATGHTLNDQAETLLMRLFRGAGPGGLSGIYAARFHRDIGSGKDVKVVRPLIDVTREQVLTYLGERGQGTVSDASNLDTSLDRNWVRRELIPQVEARLNPKAALALARTAELMAEIEQHLEDAAKRTLSGCLRREDGLVRIRFEDLARTDLAVQRQMVRSLIIEAGGTLDRISLHLVDQVLRLGRRTSGRRIELPGDICAWNEFGCLRLGRHLPVGEFSHFLEVPGELILPDLGKRVSASIESAGSELQAEDRLLVIRNRRPGDRLRPLAGQGDRKLKRLFTERRIPAAERDRLLVVEQRGRVVGIEGISPASGEELHLTPGIRVRIETFPG